MTIDVDGEETLSPMNQDPLLLIPDEARHEVEQRLNRRHRREYRLQPGPGALMGANRGGLFALWAAVAHPAAFSAVEWANTLMASRGE